ncbi:SRPBCC family protein [Oceanobacillus picturae]|uniref:SRPBCC family protein n=1 Tax=Oceanobacillus picturae TaxID=171693 RepID=UPI003B8321CC
MKVGTSKEIRVEATVQAPVGKVWKYWTEPAHIKQWNNASDDWHTPFAENDLKVGGTFVSRMEAKDGSTGFDFGGIYDEVILHEVIAYTMADGRKVKIVFKGDDKETDVVETFDADASHPAEFQQQGWQAILNNFKSYVEQNEH